jgi:(R,R)-butanediol dehydrogenase / meso-butanediol dehydrogenase / diacetyl reductase
VRALRFHAARDLRLEAVDEVSPPAGWVKLSVAGCGICGTDVHEYTNGPKIVPTPEHPHPLTHEALPLTLGHELSGTVVELGDRVDGFACGDRVAVEPTIACGACAACLSGQRNRCPQKGAVGLTGWGGGYADYVTLPESMLHPLPDEVSLEAGALVEPVAVGWHGARLANVGPGSVVLIVGAGPIGLGALAAAKALGAKTAVVAVRRPGARATMARNLGADAVLLSGSEDLPPLLADLTGGRGVDVAFESSGSPEGLHVVLRSVAIGGAAVTLGLWGEPANVDLNTIMLREISLIGSRGYANEYPAVIDAIATGAIRDIERMITKRVPLSAAVPDGFEELAGRQNDQVKILVIP